MVFAREINDNLTGLVKKLDAEVAKNKSAKLCGFVVFLNDDEATEAKVKALHEKGGVKSLSLAIDNPAGPATWKIAKDAEVTVILYKGKKVQVNHAFKKGELNGQAIDKVVSDLSKISG